MYRHAGIRSVEIGSVMFGANARHELLRLAIPRRVYTQSHIDYVVEAILEVNASKGGIHGLEIVEERRYHFGTTWWFVLKPPKDRTVLLEKKSIVDAAEVAVEEKPRPWWTAWWK